MICQRETKADKRAVGSRSSWTMRQEWQSGEVVGVECVRGRWGGLKESWHQGHNVCNWGQVRGMLTADKGLGRNSRDHLCAEAF